MIETLKKISIFNGLSDDDLAALAAIVVTRHYPKNAVIVNEGEKNDTMFLVLQGRLKIYVSDATGHELVLNIQGEGDYFGEMVLDEGPRSASVMTLEPCELAMITRRSLQDCIAANPSLAVAMIHNLIHRCRILTGNAKDLALLDVYGRLSKLLMALAEERDGQLVVGEKLTKQAMGDRIGASREMVSRILKDLTAGGYVRMEKGRLHILRKPPAHW
ncbi:MAG: Crp/Fnr family transcriptional regulator [Rhodocyclaceae bacterium]|nr:Crp/Fnr family transcriptional regulator [Rhodocyclaceae bacterium]